MCPRNRYTRPGGGLYTGPGGGMYTGPGGVFLTLVSRSNRKQKS